MYRLHPGCVVHSWHSKKYNIDSYGGTHTLLWISHIRNSSFHNKTVLSRTVDLQSRPPPYSSPTAGQRAFSSSGCFDALRHLRSLCYVWYFAQQFTNKELRNSAANIRPYSGLHNKPARIL